MVPLKPAADAAAGAGGNGGGAQPPPMTFIDFEYSERAPRGFDLGNHFCE